MIFYTSCSNTTKETKKSDSSVKKNIDSSKIVIDTLNKNQSLTKENSDTLPKYEELISVQDWKIEDFIIDKKDKNNKSLISNLEYDKEEWKNVKNPIIATYQGCDFGDYFHITFQDADGINYDFGFGNNHFGEYILYDKTQYVDNPKYLGKKFKVYWNWKISNFPCCDGEHESVKAYHPSITKLELMTTK